LPSPVERARNLRVARQRPPRIFATVHRRDADEVRSTEASPGIPSPALRGRGGAHRAAVGGEGLYTRLAKDPHLPSLRLGAPPLP
jgi:hypothetical protein